MKWNDLKKIRPLPNQTVVTAWFNGKRWIAQVEKEKYMNEEVTSYFDIYWTELPETPNRSEAENELV